MLRDDEMMRSQKEIKIEENLRREVEGKNKNITEKEVKLKEAKSTHRQKRENANKLKKNLIKY